MVASTLLLDLDGTIWDSRPWYAKTIELLCGSPASLIESQLSEGANIVVLAQENGVSRRQLAHAASNRTSSLNLYEGVLHTMERLRERSVRLGVVTNLPGWLATPLLESTGIDSYFATIVTPRFGIPAKPKPHGINKALRVLGKKPDMETWYVGDGHVDAEASKAANLQFAWVSYGYEFKKPNRTMSVIEQFDDVLQL